MASIDEMDAFMASGEPQEQFAKMVEAMSAKERLGAIALVEWINTNTPRAGYKRLLRFVRRDGLAMLKSA